MLRSQNSIFRWHRDMFCMVIMIVRMRRDMFRIGRAIIRIYR